MDDIDEQPQPSPRADAAGTTSSGLPDELSRRLVIKDQAPASDPSELVRPQPRLLCEERHDAGEESSSSQQQDGGIVSKWRQKEKLKTTAVALVLCLNIGVDPPDVIKISPCARLECWVDPMSMQPAKALEAIGKNLQAQYERWQPRAKYKMHLDPTLEDVKKLCLSCRRNAKNERVLFHYNGHGVPRPTANGEVWVFNSRYTQYIPLSIYELQSWLGTPCIYVLDCSAAGVVINSFRAFMDQRQQDMRMVQGGMNMYGGAPFSSSGGGSGADPMKEIIALAACGANELLPQTPELPADVFTACLTTPIKVALRWFCNRSLLRHDGLTKELIDKIPGRQTDRKTPLGELNWIFTAITDTIAWNMLPRALFQKLFRSDLLVASLFRNFLLAERIMTAANCTPISYPRLPPTHQHPMWQAWDMAAEMCLMQLPTLLSDPNAEFQPSNFFSEQLTAFELWLQHGSKDKKPPEQLPIVLQVLLSQVHRLRALVLLGRFLDMGPWAVDLALSVGIFPYVLKLLQTTSTDLRSTLVFIWCKILALDKTCQVDLVKDNGHLYFIRYLDTLDANIDLYSRSQAAFVLSVICDNHPKGQALCASANLLAVLLKWLRSLFPPQLPLASPGHALLLKWLCLCLGKLCQDMPEISLMAIREGAADMLVQLLTVASPDIRAAAVFGLGCLVHSCPPGGVAGAGAGDLAGIDPQLCMAPSEDRLPAEQLIANAVRQVVYDPSILVRAELAVLYARFVRGHAALVQQALQQQQRKLAEFVRSQQLQMAQQQQAARASASYDASLDSAAGGADGQGRPNTAPGWRSGEDAAQGVGRQTSWAPAPSDAMAPPPSGGTPPGSHTPQSQQLAAVQAQQALADRPGSAPPPSVSSPPPPSRAASTGPVDASTSTYTALLESVQMLALDPSPKVARLGRDVLRIAQYELNFVAPSLAGANGSLSPRMGGQGALGGVFSQVLRPRAWRAGGLAPHHPGSSSTRPISTSGPSVSSTPSSSSPSSPTRETPLAFSRHPYVLKTTGQGQDGAPLPSNASDYGDSASAAFSGGMGMGGMDPGVARNASHGHAYPGHLPNPGMAGSGGVPGALGAPGTPGGGAPGMHPDGSAGSLQGMAMMGGPASGGPGGAQAGFMMGGAMGGTAGGVGGGGAGGAGGGSAAGAVLPASLIWRLSCEYFSRPMLEPMSSAWRESDGAVSCPWTAPVDPHRKLHRAREIEAGVAKCRALTVPKLREQVYSIETGSEYVTALAFHPYHPLLCTADARGFLRITNYNTDNKAINAFHVTDGSPPSDTSRVLPSHTVFLRQLNETDGPMLLAGSMDGAVRVWRQYCVQGAQRMATALQAVTIHLPPATGHTTVFEWSAQRSHLYAAGGSHPEMVYCWDLMYEMCSNMIPMGSPPGPTPAVDRLVLGQADPHLLLCACSDTSMRIFDVRASRAPAMVLQPTKAPLAGVVFEPNGRSGTVICASEKGELKFLDMRMACNTSAATADAAAPPAPQQGANASCVVRTVQAHSKGGVSALVAHPHAPLLATGTTTQVVKLWTDTGEVVGAIRAQSSLLAHKMGPVTCMAFHPYGLLLAAGGGDSVCTVYAIDNAPGHRLPASSASVASVVM